MGLIIHGILGALSRILLLYHQEFGRASQGNELNLCLFKAKILTVFSINFHLNQL